MADAFLFGKLPSHGDFVSRGLGEAQVRAFDGWLSASLDAAAALPGFDGLYALAPAWRFMAAFDGTPHCGIVALSVDSVGRRFPVVVGARGVSDALIEACQTALYTAFSEGSNADALHAALASAPEAAPIEADADRWYLEDGDGAVVEALSGAYPPDLISRMIEAARLTQ